MKDIIVSIIVPIYNVERYLCQCVDSIIHQTYTKLEVILVNDGSTDRSPKICDEYLKKDKRVKVIHKKNGGSSSAREVGVNAATGNYLMFVDGDDWIDLNTIESCIDQIEKYDDLKCVMFSYVKETSNTSIPMDIMDETLYLQGSDVEEKVYRRLFGLSGKELSHPERMENVVSCCMKLYRSDCVQRGKYFDTKVVGSCEDGLFNMYALYECDKIMYLNKHFYHYRKTEGTLTSSFRPHLIQQWETLFEIMNEIIKEKNLGKNYEEALESRIALSITAIGLNELSNPAHGMMGHIKVIKGYLKQERYHNTVKKINVKNMPLPWKMLMLSCKMKCAMAVYAAIVAIDKIRKH